MATTYYTTSPPGACGFSGPQIVPAMATATVTETREDGTGRTWPSQTIYSLHPRYAGEGAGQKTAVRRNNGLKGGWLVVDPGGDSGQLACCPPGYG